MLEVDFQNLCIYGQISGADSEVYLSRLSKITNLHSKVEVYFKYTF